MTVLLPWFALVVTVLAGWAIIKRLSTSMVLLFAGLAMISFAVICGVHGFLPKGVKPSGFVWFDIFELLRSIATKQTSGIGLFDYGRRRLRCLHGQNRRCSRSGSRLC